MLAEAKKTMSLCDALSRDPNFNWTDSRHSPYVLRHTFDFARNTWESYWRKLLPGTVLNEIRCHGDQDSMRVFASRDPTLKKATWPKFDGEVFMDCRTRNMTSAMSISDKGQKLFNQRYDFSDEVMQIARELMPTR